MGDKRVAAGAALEVRPDICCSRDQRPRRRLPHVTLLMIAGGSATGLSANGACIVRVLWPMMGDGALYPCDCPGDSIPCLDHIMRLNPLREPRIVPIFELGLVCRAPRGVPLSWATLTSDERSHNGRAAAIRFVQ